jgi:hypothetical protein
MTPIQQEAERRWPKPQAAGVQDRYKGVRQMFSEHATFGYSLAQQEIDRLKGLVKEIDKALYIGGDLEDKDVLDFYIQVAKTIKETIADFKQQHNL